MKYNTSLALLTGITIALALPPFRTGFLAYIALLPFFLLLQNKSKWESFRWGYITGLFIFIFSLFWIGWVTLPGLLGVLIIMPLFFSVYAVLHVLFREQFPRYYYIILPFLWITIEYLMSLGETAFPWVHLGYTQTYYLYLIQYADITAVYGVSFWIVCINIVFFLWYLKRIKSVKAIGVLFVFFLFPFLYSLSAQQKYDKHQEKIKIALIQGNIDPFEKWNQQNNLRQLAVYDSLTKAAMHQHPDLIIWPETATPYSLRKEYQYLEIVRHIVKSTNRPLITGSIDFEYVDNKLNYYNAVLLLEPGTNTIQKYAKMKLVPFSEKVPYSRYFLIGIFKDFLYDLEMGVGDYARGTRYNLFSFKKQNHIKSKTDSLVTFTTQICYESVFPNHIRKFVLKDADFISIITNDAWFGKTTAPFQHKQIAVFRAIENRRAIARCANTGISCFIDPFGRVGKQTGVFKQAKIVDHISLEKTKTFYTVHGNVFVKLCAGILILTLIILIINKGTYHFSKS